MKFGQLLEIGDSDRIFEQAENDYTRELIALMPRFEQTSPAGL